MDDDDFRRHSMVPRRILVPTDGSPSAQKAEAFAASMADLMGECEVMVVNVIHPRDKVPTSASQIAPLFTPEQIGAAEATVEAAVERIRGLVASDRVRVSTAVLEGHSAAKAIIEQAESLGTCDLIVLGARGLGGFPSLILGSTSQQVLHGSRCPVAIVKI
jgi:nucleotide-binding universal stress UspA family protein